MVDKISNLWRQREPRASKFYSGLVNKENDGYFKEPIGIIKYIKTTNPEVGYKYLDKMTRYKFTLDEEIADKANIRDKATNGDEVLLLDQELAELNEHKISKLRLFFVALIAVCHSGLVKFCKIAMPLSSTSMNENVIKLALKYIMLPITGFPLLISLFILSFAGFIHRRHTKRSYSPSPVENMDLEKIKNNNIAAARYNRIGYSVINLAITAGIILGLVNPILLIPVAVVGIAVATVFFGAAHKNSTDNYQPLNQYEIGAIHQDDSKTTKKVGYIMTATLVLAITNIIAFILTIPVLSNPWIFLSILIARPFLESIMHYLNNKDLNNQIDYIDGKLLELSQEKPDAITLIDSYKNYRQFLIDRQKTPASWNTFLEFGFGLRIVIMSFFSIAGFALFPASPFIALAFAFIFILISVINRIYTSTRMSKPENFADELVDFNIDEAAEYDLNNLSEAIDKVYETDRRYSIVIKTLKASVVLIAAYAFFINIPAVGVWLGISAMSVFPGALLIAAIGFAVVAIAASFGLESLKRKKIEVIKEKFNPTHKPEHPIFKEKSLYYFKSQAFNRAWAITAIPIIVFAIGLIANLAFFATPIGIVLLSTIGLAAIVVNVINIVKYNTAKKKMVYLKQVEDEEDEEIIEPEHQILKDLRERLTVQVKRNKSAVHQKPLYMEFFKNATALEIITDKITELAAFYVEIEGKQYFLADETRLYEGWQEFFLANYDPEQHPSKEYAKLHRELTKQKRKLAENEAFNEAQIATDESIPLALFFFQYNEEFKAQEEQFTSLAEELMLFDELIKCDTQGRFTSLKIDGIHKGRLVGLYNILLKLNNYKHAQRNLQNFGSLLLARIRGRRLSRDRSMMSSILRQSKISRDIPYAKKPILDFVTNFKAKGVKFLANPKLMYINIFKENLAKTRIRSKQFQDALAVINRYDSREMELEEVDEISLLSTRMFFMQYCKDDPLYKDFIVNINSLIKDYEDLETWELHKEYLNQNGVSAEVISNLESLIIAAAGVNNLKNQPDVSSIF